MSRDISVISSIQAENANYGRVVYYIDKMLSENDRYCRCHRCRLDAVALALNTLPPHYFVDSRHLREKDLGSSWILIEVAVREALEKVHRFPHHTPADKEAVTHQTDASLPAE